MARVAKSKKNKEISIDSRAARRAPSPSLGGDKSTLDSKADKEDTGGHGSPYAGVSKKKRTKPLTRQQRLRQEKALERASQNLDKLSKKVDDSYVREKKVKTRNAAWDELNEKIAIEPGTTKTQKKATYEEDFSDVDDSINVDDVDATTDDISENVLVADANVEDVELDEVL